MQSISETDLAYFAGLFDGEGCISFYPDRHGKEKYVRLIVANTDPSPLWEMESKFGGRICQREARGNRKTCYVWQMQRAAGCYTVLKTLLPYLRIKRQKAEEAIRYIENTPWKRIKTAS